ncbi:MAG: class I mannose-6-phosphate isomerase [Planctomycetota bacterium]|nr:MAG: class I mannose-6-phosphate isomerase [Planctomycetota bacterium]
MNALYPLRFRPALRHYLWGGTRLEALGKKYEADSCAESWEVVDRHDEQSVVAAGPLEGRTLNELVRDSGPELLGKHAPRDRFPLLFKFLDARERLSIQVHPDDARAALLDPPDSGKSEAWVVLDVEPHSYLYAGLRRGIDADLLRRELARRTIELCCERIEPRVGECVYLPAGVIHAIGPGVLAAEIQQSSDTTYRLYDYDRRGPDGKPRELQVEPALEAIDYEYGPVSAQRPRPTDTPGVERLVECEYFVLDRWQVSGTHSVPKDDCCHILAVVGGQLEIPGDASGEPLTRGGVVLLPAARGKLDVRAAPGTIVLDAYLP